MSAPLILTSIFLYFCILLLIAWVTGRNANSEGYFLGNKQSPWFAVAFGLIGDSLSGVTFISAPGWVGTTQFSYLQIVLGYVLGYIVIAQVLLPVYYRLNLTSIYSYLRGRFGPRSQKTGSFFFLLSRLLGAAARLYLAATVVQTFVFDKWGIPFAATTSIIILLILIYTFKGGIKTLVWTDTFQSSLLLLGVVLSIAAIMRQLDLNLFELVSTVLSSGHSQIFFWEWQDKKFFIKQFLSGASIAIVMTGLDQNMMQKNLSCRSLREAQKNIYAFTAVMVLVNVFFLCLGALLYEFARQKGVPIPAKTDLLFPTLALQYMGLFAAMVFMLGLTAATFSSADSVLTTLTTSFCIDLLDMDKNTTWTEAKKVRIRRTIHIVFALLLLEVILLFQAVNTQAVISAIFSMASYTYGPLLGLFAFGLFTRKPVWDMYVPLVCILSPIVCYILDKNSMVWFGGYQFGFELLILNGAITWTGLWIISQKESLK